jgi:hypothetical protein
MYAACRFRTALFVVHAEPTPATREPGSHHKAPNQGSQAVNTLLIATQIACYSIGIVSASLNIASFVRVRRIRRQRSARVPAGA